MDAAFWWIVAANYTRDELERLRNLIRMTEYGRRIYPYPVRWL